MTWTGSTLLLRPVMQMISSPNSVLDWRRKKKETPSVTNMMDFCILLLYTPEQQKWGSIFAGYQIVVRGDCTSIRSLKLFLKKDITTNSVQTQECNVSTLSVLPFFFFFEKRQGQQLIKGKTREKKNKPWETRKLIFYTEPLRTRWVKAWVGLKQPV